MRTLVLTQLTVLCALQLTLLLQEYFEIKGNLHDTTCEHDLKDFLSRRAAKYALLYSKNLEDTTNARELLMSDIEQLEHSLSLLLCLQLVCLN